LPAIQDARLETIALPAGGADADASFGDVPEYVREKETEWRIQVPEDLQISHPLVRAAQVAIRRALRQGKRDRPVHWNERYQALLVKPEPGHLDISVAKPLVQRALRIMQALVAALERRGYGVSIGTGNETIVTVLGERMQIALVEGFKRIPIQRTYSSGIDLQPSGLLRLRLGGSYSSSGVADSLPRLIEHSLNRFVAGLVKRALRAKHDRAARQERERRWAVHDNERRQRQQKRDSERLRLRRLRTLGARWTRQQRLAQFVAAVDRRTHNEPLTSDIQELAGQWIRWAKDHLRGTDPVDTLLQDPWPIAPLPGPAPMPWNWD